MSVKEPANLKLLFATEQDIQGMRSIKVLDIMEGMTKNFHPDGLFSTDIFGKVGGEFRNRLFSFIDLKVPVFHPTLFKGLMSLKGLYEEIIYGKSYAVFNPETKDFEKSTVMAGETGFHFFCQHLDRLELHHNDVKSRKRVISLLAKYRKQGFFISKLLVLPAGLRDYFVDETGKPGEDEINEYYRKIMKTSFSLETIAVDDNLEHLDSIRANLQRQIQELYEYLINMLKGKRGAIQAHWTTRRIVNSTRNVITSYIPVVTQLKGDRSVGVNETVVGLYQFMRAAIPLVIKEIRERFSQKVFIAQNAPAALINKKTLKREQVAVDSTYYDAWLTYDGLEKLLGNYADHSLRHKTLEMDGYFMALLYKGPDKTFKMIFDIDEIPEERREQAEVTPITLTEMLYICVYEMSKKVGAFMTRYPVAGYGGIYPTMTYLKITVDAEVLTELDDFWEPLPYKAMEFPIRGDKFFESLSPAASHIQAMGA